MRPGHTLWRMTRLMSPRWRVVSRRHSPTRVGMPEPLWPETSAEPIAYARTRWGARRIMARAWEFERRRRRAIVVLPRVSIGAWYTFDVVRA